MHGLDRQIRYFLKIAELSSLSKAADEMDLTQSGLSRQLSALESRLGKNLFVRTGRGVKLTEAGEKLAEMVRQHYQQIDIALDTIRDRELVVEGSLRLAIIHTLSHHFLSNLMARFLSQYGYVNISVMARSSPKVVDLVERDQADLGFVYDTAVASDGLQSIPLFDDEMCLVSQKGKLPKYEPMDLTSRKLPLIAFPQHYALRKMLKSAGLEKQVVAEANTIEAVLHLVSLGIGSSILPSHVSKKLLVEYQLEKHRICAPILKRRVVAIIRSNTNTPLLVQQLLEMAVHNAVHPL